MNLDLHSKPVSLYTLQSVGELKAVHLQQIKESVSYHTRNAVLSLC